jgi:hypothetical protein
MTWSSTRILLFVASLVVAHSLPAAAADPTPTPSPTPAAKGDTTLSDVAGGIKLEPGAASSDGGIVISNENLPELAGKGHVTEVTRQGPQQGRRELADVQGSGAAVQGRAEGYAENMEQKQYWQAIYGQQLDLIRDLNEQIEILDYEIPGLWRDFYAWDDPAYRDGVIKPKLDEALARRQKLEVDQQQAQAKLNEIKDQARREGAQPGWFRGFDPLPTPKPTEGVMPP